MSSTLHRISGALSDHYRLIEEIGAGGMATVYLAEDLRHGRHVALKVLRPELAAVIGAERFLAEIKLTANLQHPHILPLFDSGEAVVGRGTQAASDQPSTYDLRPETFLYYVMPFIEGESLRDRLQREKQLPVEDAVRVAREVADALDYAHRHGVIHRDIKPENILLHDGRALVADFGIALAASKASGNRMTETGMSLGTPHYMSPEQAMGEREITARSDVYALGAVLYEMLTGDPPFTGSTAQAVVARVVTESPRPLIPQRHTIPPHVEAAVMTALEKLPADRFASAAQFAEALIHPMPMATRPIASARSAGVAPRGGIRSRLHDPVTLGLAALAVAALGAAAVLARRPAAQMATPTVRFVFTGSDSAPTLINFPWPAAISPDGSLLAYAVPQPGSRVALAVRRTDQLEGHLIPGTDGASQPLFSPDGRWVAFEANDMEKKVRLDGSAPVAIAPGGASNGADWTTTDELILGATGRAHGLSRVSVAGGELMPFTAVDSTHGELEHLWPIASPDGQAVVFTISYGPLERSELAIASLDGGSPVRLGLRGIRPLAMVDDALVYVRADGAVMGVPIDVRRRRVLGRPVPVLDPVPVYQALNGNSDVFVSRGGALVYGLHATRARLIWLDRSGLARAISPELRNFDMPRISPDGRKIAVVVADGAKRDVWIYELDGGTFSRLTSMGNVTSLEWTRDGERIVFSADSGGTGAVWTQSVGDATDPELLLRAPNSVVASLAPDGRSLLLQVYVNTDWDVQRVALDSPAVFRQFHASPSVDYGPRISPDGRWAALQSRESGALEVYARSYPQPNVKVQVSVGGGAAPVWAADGKSLYYTVGGDAIVQARLATAPGLRVVARDTVFRRVPGAASSFAMANYDVSRDGTRLVVPSAQSAGFPLVVVPNWRQELRERLGATRK
jgi:serine/threonine-protein kinase